jgi:hypothetical protein
MPTGRSKWGQLQTQLSALIYDLTVPDRRTALEGPAPPTESQQALDDHRRVLKAYGQGGVYAG